MDASGERGELGQLHRNTSVADAVLEIPLLVYMRTALVKIGETPNF
jgi:hypothetical protein